MYLSLSLQCLPAVYSVSILFRGKVNICQSVGYWDNFVAGLCSILNAVFMHQICAECTLQSKYKTSLNITVLSASESFQFLLKYFHHVWYIIIIIITYLLTYLL